MRPHIYFRKTGKLFQLGRGLSFELPCIKTIKSSFLDPARELLVLGAIFSLSLAGFNILNMGNEVSPSSLLIENRLYPKADAPMEYLSICINRLVPYMTCRSTFPSTF